MFIMDVVGFLDVLLEARKANAVPMINTSAVNEM